MLLGYKGMICYDPMTTDFLGIFHWIFKVTDYKIYAVLKGMVL